MGSSLEAAAHAGAGCEVVDLEDTIQSERCQAQKDACCMTPLGGPQSHQVQRDRMQTDGCQGLGEGRGLLVNSQEFRFRKMKSSGDWLYNSVNAPNTLEL